MAISCYMSEKNSRGVGGKSSLIKHGAMQVNASMDVDAKQPPDEEERNDGQEKMTEPLAGGVRSAEVEHEVTLSFGRTYFKLGPGFKFLLGFKLRQGL